MEDLEDFMPKTSATVEAIYAWHKTQGDAEPQRGYLGASIIGHECERYLWYLFRGCVREDFPGRLYRLFERGDLEEPRMVKELRGIGCTVHDVDPQTGRQWEVNALGGHFSGHMDGCCQGIPEAPKAWHVCEFKTAKGKLFDKLKKEGVQVSYPKHYAQMQCYMGLTGMKRAFYLSCNKDTDELYAERVKFEASHYQALMEKARRIISTSQAPERMASRPDDWRCKFCSAHALCWGLGDVAVPIPEKTCKSCCHSTADTDAESKAALWKCERFNTLLESTSVGAECPSHLLLPGLVSFADPVDSGEDWIEFQSSEDGGIWRHGGQHYTTEELISRPFGRLPADLAEDPGSLLASYPWGDSERVWDGPAHELADALTELGWPPARLLEIEAGRSQIDKGVDAVEYVLDGEDYLVIRYRADESAAIWKGKE